MPDLKRVEAGFDAEALDPAIAAARERLSQVIIDVERVRGGLEPHLNEVRLRLERQLADGNLADADLLARTERLIDWLERYAKVSLTFTKVVDEATRLRSFVAGGADSRPDLSSLSDSQLLEIIRKGNKAE